MKFSRFKDLIPLFFEVTLLALLLPSTYAQEKAAQGASAEIVLGQLSEAFSGGHAVQEVQISGSAAWYAGGLEDSGSVSLSASTDGSSHMQLSLAATGQKTETQTGTGVNAKCQWAKADGIAHAVDRGNCRRSVLWFLPALSLQPSQLPSSLGVADLGEGTVGSGTTTYRHLQSQSSFSDLPASISKVMIRRSTTDLGLDPATLLPAVLAYSVPSDNGAPVSIAIEIRYSDYRTVSGVQIPFLIQRYVNGSLQLEVRVSSAQVN